MTQLKTTFAGLSLRNPIIISSSSLTNSAEKNKKLELAGAGAIVLKSVFEEQIMMEAHHMATYGSPEGDDYLSTYVRSHALNEYISLIEQTKKLCTIPVIASINCYQDADWIEFARKIEEAGADALEVNILALQTDIQYAYGSFEQRHIDILSHIRKTVNIPVIMKLGDNLTNPIALIDQLYAKLQEQAADPMKMGAVQGQYGQFNSAGTIIGNLQYNDAVYEYQNDVGGFPASVLGAVAGVKEVEPFA